LEREFVLTSRRKALYWVGGIFLSLFVLLFLVSLIIRPRISPIAKSKIESVLSAKFDSTVTIDTFNITLFPRITVEAGGVTMRHFGRTDIAPLIQIDRLSAHANWGTLLRAPRHVSSVQIQGLHIHTPPREPGQHPKRVWSNQDLASKYQVLVDVLHADGATLETTPSKPGKNPRLFEIHHLEMQHLSLDRPSPFHAELTNPVPKGEIDCKGEFGPWVPEDPALTPVKADYTFANADMATIKALSGIMNSKGSFGGPLDYLDVAGWTDIPKFQIRSSKMSVPLHTDYKAVVDGTNGDTILKEVDARFLHSLIVATGEVIRQDEPHGHLIVVKAVSKGARIEDMLQLAVGNDPPVMNGPMELKADLQIPVGPQDYLDRMKLKGEFGVDSLHFANPDIEKKVATFSNKAQGNPQSDSESTPATLKGTFDMDGGIITFSNLHFQVTGASVDLAGTYGMDDGALDFQGALRMDARLSQTMTGVKSFFLKAVDPFFAKNGAGTYVPIKITGTKDHPVYGLNFHHKDKTEKN
jgi:AsmA-like C-terminal region